MNPLLIIVNNTQKIVSNNIDKYFDKQNNTFIGESCVKLYSLSLIVKTKKPTKCSQYRTLLLVHINILCPVINLLFCRIPFSYLHSVIFSKNLYLFIFSWLP